MNKTDQDNCKSNLFPRILGIFLFKKPDKLYQYHPKKIPNEIQCFFQIKQKEKVLAFTA